MAVVEMRNKTVPAAVLLGEHMLEVEASSIFSHSVKFSLWCEFLH